MIFKKRGAQNVIEIGLLIAVVTVASIYFYTTLGAQTSKLSKMSAVTKRQPTENVTEEVAGVSAAKGFKPTGTTEDFSSNENGTNQTQTSSSNSSAGLQKKIETTGVKASATPTSNINVKVGK